MSAALTQDLGAFIAGLRYEDIPQDALPVIRLGFTDCVGVMIAGRGEPPPTLLASVLGPFSSDAPASLLFGKQRAPAPEAACINGAAAHVLDFDDVALRGHPSCVLVPAILAEAETLGASGRQMMTAYAAGYETWAELVRRDPGQHHSKGWHPTGIFGAIAAAAACASLRGLTAPQAANALAIGATQSAGLMANFGSMSKSFHAGRSAQSGLLAARLAQAGFTGSPDALEHPQGYLQAVSPAGECERDAPIEAGRVWKMPTSRLSVKKYPMCFATHRAIDGLLGLLKAGPLAAGQIERINASVSRRNAAILRNHRPQTGLEAKFSMEFAMAAVVIAGRLTLLELTDEFVTRPDVQAMMQRVTVEPDDRYDPNPNANGYAIYDLVTVHTTDGDVREGEKVNLIRGGPNIPLEPDELWAKFDACVQAGGAAASGRLLFDALMDLDHCADARRLNALIA
ncbi:MmgE/PrpD family protein [Bordetella petrii]|nr:MmgE/PrpD family protein [Bordetella petrii]